MLTVLFALAALTAPILAQAPAAEQYVVPAKFPKDVFASYYVPASPSQNPQPAVHDPVNGNTYPLNLTSPTTIPKNDTEDPVILPPGLANLTAANAAILINTEMQQAYELFSSLAGGSCPSCVAALNIFKSLALIAPEYLPAAMVQFCVKAKLGTLLSCEQNFGANDEGQVFVQVFANADVSGLDGRYICNKIGGLCSAAPVYPVTIAKFPKPKPVNATAPKPSGKRVKVAHLSDFHLDPRYAVGSEANCTTGLCCRTDEYNANLNTSPNGTVSEPAPLFGSFRCDTPYWLAIGALESMATLFGLTKANAQSDAAMNSTPIASGDFQELGFTIYTGDLVSHDPSNELSRSYVEYTEASVYHMIYKFLPGPVYATLGNHDTQPTAQDAPHSLQPAYLADQFQWNYDHVAGIWKHYGWLDAAATKEVRTHYGGYSTLTPYGLRVISMNSDFWYASNIFNWINTTNPDVSGMFAWLITELQAAEDAGERVWIIDHVLTGFGTGDAMPNPSDYYYQIIDRYSPHVIANTFHGHSHQDQQMIYYANNGTNRNNSQGLADALTPGWVGPSITPLTNYNSGYRMYEVDTGSFDIMESYTFYSDVASFSELDTSKNGPTFKYEYSTRDAYNTFGWPKEAPLNATFWHHVTEAMQTNTTLSTLFNLYQGKSSVMTTKCDTIACAQAKACYIRSGSQALAAQCPGGYGGI